MAQTNNLSLQGIDSQKFKAGKTLCPPSNFASHRRELRPRTEGNLPEMPQQLLDVMLGADGLLQV